MSRIVRCKALKAFLSFIFFIASTWCREFASLFLFSSFFDTSVENLRACAFTSVFFFVSKQQFYLRHSPKIGELSDLSRRVCIVVWPASMPCNSVRMQKEQNNPLAFERFQASIAPLRRCPYIRRKEHLLR